MKFPWTLNALAGLSLLATTAVVNAAPSINTEPTPLTITALSNDELQERLAQIDLPFDPRITPTVREYIKRYLVNGYKDSELILGRAQIFFPIFEHYLNVYRLPRSLKYLPIIESALRMDVKSKAGAAGLWQFVPVGARFFDLEVNGVVDERLDPYRATEGAVKMLAFLYEELRDWPLALAAYNCGLGCVQQAIKRARCDNYWDIQQYLPHDTRRYVPAYIAAAYLGNYYQEHGLTPSLPHADQLDTRVFRVYSNVSFYKLAKAIDVPFSVLAGLNPSYVGKYIPYNRKGHFLRVPVAASAAMRAYLDQEQNIAPDTPGGYFETFYTVTPGDRIETLAALFDCKTEELMEWNGVFHSDIVVNQHLRIYLPKTNRLLTRP